MDYNYFEVLELSIDDIQDKDEATIKALVNEAHTKRYALTIGAYANMPRSDGLTQAQWQKVLNDAKDTLLDPRKRRKHIATLTEAPEELEQPVLTFPGGEEARTIADLAALLEKHPTIAADALYAGTLEQNLRSADQNQFADAAKTIVDQFSEDRDTGFMAMVAVLHGEVRIEKEKGANTPKHLARLIDRNWDQSKTLLSNGFFAFWLAHIEQHQLADTANEITNRYSDQQDLALETFVQALDPRIGNPIPNISPPEIYFNTVAADGTETSPSETNNIAKTVATDSAKTIRSEIKNAGRGFLHGDVHLKSDIPGLQLSDTKIHGAGIVSIHLDESVLTSKEAHRTALVINTNGRNLEVPIYINHGIQPLLRWVGISGVSMAALALFTRLIVATAPLNVAWAAPLIFGIGIYAHWLLVVRKSFSWQRFLMPILPIILPIKNFLQAQDYRKLIKALVHYWIYIAKLQIAFFVKVTKFCFRWVVHTIRFSRSPFLLIFVAFGVVVFVGIVLPIVLPMLFGSMVTHIVAEWILPVVLAPFLALASILTGLDKLFHLGFNIHIVISWTFWGLVMGLAIQGYRAMEIYDRKRMKLWVAAAPILLLCVTGTIRYVSALNPPSIDKTTSVAAQSTAGLETETITREAPEPVATKQSTTEADGDSMVSAAPVPTAGQEKPAPLPPTPPTELPAVIPNQETTARPPPEPKPAPPVAPLEPEPIRQAATEPEEKIIPPPEPVPVNTQEKPAPLPPTPPTEPPIVTPKQEIPTLSTPDPKPITPTVLSDMVLIPAGEFQMGSNDKTDEKPIHTVYIDAFYMDTYEVTNAQYKMFADANPQWRKTRIPTAFHNGNYLKHWNGDNYPSGKGDHPVTYVSWYGAMAYANWVGKRLPTEAEWEKAARGGKSGTRYPWGNTISSRNANYGSHVGGTTAVGNYSPNEYGLYDMAGNVLEWCMDAYYSNFYRSSPDRNPLAGMNTVKNVDLVISDFVNDTASRVVRGGSWIHDEEHLRTAYRNEVSPTLTNTVLGFRCVKVVETK
ncbi:MAG: formylglycine-generating enzyme family protein [Candidatus Poribacteria bacterium]|nr:formylglycine-generating enzyme family protein [Candidatus Poribacteria bacterium]